MLSDVLCKLCGEVCAALSYDKIVSRYHRCLNCQLIFKDTSSLISDGEAVALYDLHINTLDDPGYVAYFKKFIDKCIVNFVLPTAQGLDFGSGPEPVLAHLLRRDYGFAVDIYDKFYAPVRVFEGKQYDLITATEVVEHLEEPLDYFKLFSDLLKPSGILAVMTQFHPNDVDKFENWHYRRDETHVSFYTPKTMAYIAQRFGFEIVYIDTHKNVAFKKL